MLKASEKITLLTKGLSWKEIKELDTQLDEEKELEKESEKEPEKEPEKEFEKEFEKEPEKDEKDKRIEELEEEITKLRDEHIHKDISGEVVDSSTALLDIFKDFR